MNVIKKNGKVEHFSITKLKLSLANSAKDIGIILTEADLNLLSKEIIKTLESLNSDNITSTYEVTGVVIQALKMNSFEKVVQRYINY